MKTPSLSQDILPLSRFRATLADTVRRIRATRRPVIVTQHGESSVVVVDVDEYQALLDELEVVRDVVAAERELDQGAGIEAEDAKAAVLANLHG